MGTIIGLVLLALAVLVTVITIAVFQLRNWFSPNPEHVHRGDIPNPRSSERTIEERILAESQEEADVTARRVELQRERQRLVEERRQFHTQIRAQDATGVTDRRGADLVAATQRVTTVTGPTGGSPGQSGKPSQKADTSAPVKRKSRYERDPVI